MRCRTPLFLIVPSDFWSCVIKFSRFYLNRNARKHTIHVIYQRYNYRRTAANAACRPHEGNHWFPDCNWLHACNCFFSSLLLGSSLSSSGFECLRAKVFAQHFRAGRIPSPWFVMNILLHCYVIYTQGLGFEKLPLSTG